MLVIATKQSWGMGNGHKGRREMGHQTKPFVFSCTISENISSACGCSQVNRVLLSTRIRWIKATKSWVIPQTHSAASKEMQLAAETHKALALCDLKPDQQGPRCCWRREAEQIAGQYQNCPPARKPLGDCSVQEPKMWLKLGIISPALLHRV